MENRKAKVVHSVELVTVLGGRYIEMTKEGRNIIYSCM
jgi:hypothetical protein